MRQLRRTVGTLVALCATGHAVPLQGQGEAARLVVMQALRAVQGDSAGRVSERWRARLSRDPADRAARLGLAEVARLTYGVDAPMLYRRVCAPGQAPDAYAAYARLGLAELDYTALHFATAVAQYDSAGAVARRAGDRVAEALALMRGAYAKATTAGPAVALPIFEAAARLLPAQAPDLWAELLYRRAVILGVGDRPEAQAVADSAVALARRAGDPALEAAGYNALGFHFLGRHEYDTALAEFRRSAELYGGAHDRYRHGVELLREVDILRELAELGEARAALLAGRADGEAAHSPLVLSSASTGLGAIALQLGDYPTAIAELGRARAQFTALADTPSLAIVDYYEGLARAGAGDLAAGRRILTRSAAYFRGYGDFENYLQSARGLVFVLTRQQDWPAAEAVLAQARALALEKRHPEWLRGLQYDEGHLALVRGDLAVAERGLTAFLATVDSSEHLRRHHTRIQLAEVYARRGQLERAEEAVATASVELDRWRSSISDRALRVYAFQANSQDVDDRGASLARVLNALALGGRAPAAFELAERNRARELGDALARAAALRQGPGSRGPERAVHSAAAVGAGAIPRAPTVRELVADLPDARTAVLEYVAGQAGAPTTVFVATRAGLVARALPPMDTLAPTIARFSALVEDGADPRDLARSLGASVLGPALAALPPGITRLIVVPDAQLYRLPFDALRLADGRYVLERYAVSTAPSSAVLLALWRERAAAGPGTGAGARLLAFGDPAFAPGAGASGSDPVRASGVGEYRDAFAATGGLARLPESGREARLVARYAPAAEVRLRQAASAAFLKHAPLERFRVIHFATHAIVDERSVARTALALAPGGGESGFVGPGDLAALRLRADLVVLSACRTAGGVLIGGEGVEGLTAPLLEAGARAVVASGWRVGDRQTVALVEAFYDALARGRPVGEALRAAKLAALRRGEPAREWAAFGVIGDPLVVVPLREPPARWAWPLLLAGLAVAGAVVVARYRAPRRSVRVSERVTEPSAAVALTHQR